MLDLFCFFYFLDVDIGVDGGWWIVRRKGKEGRQGWKQTFSVSEFRGRQDYWALACAYVILCNVMKRDAG